jgi:hypothetical protein
MVVGKRDQNLKFRHSECCDLQNYF